MATISFPSSPTLYQTVTTGNQTWAWNGEAWVSAGSLSAYYYTLPEANTTTLGGIRIGNGLNWVYSSPWTATINNISSTSGIVVGDVLTATPATGSLGTGGTYTVTSIVNSTSITFTATNGTTPLAGTITTITSNGTSFGGGTVEFISGTNGVVQASIGATGPQGPSGGPVGSTGATGASGLAGQNGQPGATGAGFSALSSTTSLTIGTGSKTFTVNSLHTDTNFIVGLYVRLYNTTTNYIEGLITSYSNYSMTVNFDTAVGSGTFTSWTLVLAGARGNIGSTGVGATGLGYTELTSTSSNTFTSGATTGTFTLTTNLGSTATAFGIGQRVRVYSTASITNFIEGNIATFSGTAMTVTVTNSNGSASGVTTWGITMAGLLGATGALGLQGATGASGIAGSRAIPRLLVTTAPTTITPDVSLYDQININGLTAGLTINAPITAPFSDGTRLLFQILDNGTSRTITWNATYIPIGVVLPVSTTASKMTYVGCLYNLTNTRWDVIAVVTQA